MASGATDLTLSVSVWNINHYFDGDGKDLRLSDLGIKVRQTDIILQLDHGLSDRLTFSASLPYSRSSLDVLALEDEDIVNDGASDARLGIKWRLSGEGATQFALLAGVKWPGDYTTNLVYAPGNGNFDAELLGSLAHRFGKLVLSADGGYRYRKGTPAGEILGRFEPSLLIGSRLTLYSSLSYVNALDGIGIDETVGVEWPFTSAEEDYLRLTTGGLISVSSRLALFAGWSGTLDGRSTARGSQWTAGTKVSF
jgi:hypothetical protein